MQENDFEKKMRRTMDAWQVQPNEEVWQKVKAQVSQKKRRRGFIFFFLFFGLLTAGILVSNHADFFTANTSRVPAANAPAEKKIQENAVTPGQTGNNIAINDNTIVTGKQSAVDDEALLEMQQPAPEPVAAVAGSSNSSMRIPGNNGNRQTHLYSYRKKNIKGSVKAAINPPLPQEDAASNKNMLTDEPAAANTIVEVSADKKDKVLSELPAVQPADSPATGKKDIAETPTGKTKPQKTTTPDKKKKSTWQFSVNVSGGISFAGFNNGKLLSAASDGLSNPPVTGGTTGNQASYYPSDVTPGFAFTAGLHIAKAINEKIKFSTGIEYRQYSALQKTGSAASFQLNDPTRLFVYGNSVVNRHLYQYLSVPAGISVNIFNAGSKAVWLDGGINYSRLLKASSLSFDTATGIYRSATAGFNKNQLGLSASLLIDLARKGKPSLYIGPQFQYSFTPLTGSGLYAYTHSRYIGIMLRRNLTK